MRIALIAGGFAPIPPDSWGAVENIIWNYKRYLERLGHTVDIYNTFVYQEIICAIRANYYDFVHTHYDPFDYSVMVKDYERIIHEFRDYYPCQKRWLA